MMAQSRRLNLKEAGIYYHAGSLTPNAAQSQTSKNSYQNGVAGHSVLIIKVSNQNALVCPFVTCDGKTPGQKWGKMTTKRFEYAAIGDTPEYNELSFKTTCDQYWKFTKNQYIRFAYPTTVHVNNLRPLKLEKMDQPSTKEYMLEDSFVQLMQALFSTLPKYTITLNPNGKHNSKRSNQSDSEEEDKKHHATKKNRSSPRNLNSSRKSPQKSPNKTKNITEQDFKKANECVVEVDDETWNAWMAEEQYEMTDDEITDDDPRRYSSSPDDRILKWLPCVF